MRYVAVEDNYGKWCVVDMEHPQWKGPPHPKIIASDMEEEHAMLIAEGKNARDEVLNAQDQAG